MLSPRLDTASGRPQAVLVTQNRTSQAPGEDTLALEARSVLQQIGVGLDQHRPLEVYRQGRVALGETSTTNRAKENGDEPERTRRPAAGPRQRTARREGSARGSRKAGAAPRLSRNVLQATYEGQVTRLGAAYPTLRTFPDEVGMWLLVNSTVIAGLNREATFLVALPYEPGFGPRAWGFWRSPARTTWIGPRHTNFFDGSICAFSPDDGAWLEGGDLRTLVDLYSVWALRQLHLEVFGRWPGKQYALSAPDPRVQAYYRLIECKEGELCGCGSETRRYAECCRSSDLRWNFAQLAAAFLKNTGGFHTRQPPASVVDFMEGDAAVPQMADVHLQIASR